MIPKEPPYIVEIDSTKFAVPEQVALLLKAVSEERDQYLKYINEINGYIAFLESYGSENMSAQVARKRFCLSHEALELMPGLVNDRT